MKEAAAALEGEIRSARRRRAARKMDGHDVRPNKDGHDVSALVIQTN